MLKMLKIHCFHCRDMVEEQNAFPLFTWNIMLDKIKSACPGIFRIKFLIQSLIRFVLLLSPYFHFVFLLGVFCR